MTKAELYQKVDHCRAQYFQPVTRAPTCIQQACEARLGLLVEAYPFKTRGLRGAAFIREGIIVLDKKMMPQRRKFYCAHEAFHFLLHADARPRFNCYDLTQGDLYEIIEWEANGAAAELIMPHRHFLARVGQAAPHIHTGQDFYLLRRELVDHFGVSAAMVHTRFDSLKYELAQYLSGTPLDELCLLSDRQQRAQGIHVTSLNTIYRDVHTSFSLAAQGNCARILSSPAPRLSREQPSPVPAGYP